MSAESISFKKNTKYRVIRDYKELNHDFKKGEVVVFSEDAYDPRLGVHRYWFIDSNGESQVWHVWDSVGQSFLSIFEEA
jgi:hypothetical protein